MRCIAVVCMLLTSLFAAAAADTKPEDIVAKHLDSIGTPEARAAVKSRALQGSLHFKDLVGGAMGDSTGNWGYVSEQRKSNFVMKFGDGPWHGERFAFDGDKTSFAVFTSSRRPSLFGDFMLTQDYLIKEGLLGGEFSTGWALENPDHNKIKLEYLGRKQIDGRDLEAVEYFPKGNSDMKVKFYFDPETFHHLMTVYSLIWQPGVGRDARDGANQRQIRYTIEERFSDFQTDNGITLPRHYDLRYTQEPQRGSTRAYDWEMTADKVFTNISLDPANFQIK